MAKGVTTHTENQIITTIEQRANKKTKNTEKWMQEIKKG